MRLLELFSGTGSVGAVATEAEWEVVSLDICDKYSSPTHIGDIMEWDFRIYPEGHFDVVWASPPCVEYSILKHNNTTMTTNMEHADSIVKRTLEIINYFKPAQWFMENPQTGMLKKRDFMIGIPYVDFDYCSFSDWGYRKRTRIWTNTTPESILCKKEECPNMVGRFHRVCFGGQGRPKEHVYESCPSGATAYRIPPRLIKHLFNLL